LHVDDRQQQHHREADVDRQEQVEDERRQRDDHQQHHRHDGGRREQMRGFERGRFWGHNISCLIRTRYASTSATALNRGPGMASPTSAPLKRACASETFSTVGTPASRAIFLIRCARWSLPLATTTGAAIAPRWYRSATA